MTEVTMASILESVTAFFTQAIAWVGEVIDVVAQNPILLIMCVGIPLVGFAAGLLGRLIRL